MHSHEVLKQAIDKVGAKKVAMDMKVSTPLVYKWCQEPTKEAGDDSSGARNPLDRTLALFRSTDEISLVNWLCNRAEGYFVANLEAESKFKEGSVHHTQTMIVEFSDVLKVIAESFANDGYIDPDEAVLIRREWQKLKSYGEEFVTACENGLFGEPAKEGS
jgi:hypothetical protein